MAAKRGLAERPEPDTPIRTLLESEIFDHGRGNWTKMNWKPDLLDLLTTPPNLPRTPLPRQPASQPASQCHSDLISF